MSLNSLLGTTNSSRGGPFPNPTLHSTSSASGQARYCLGSTASSSCLLKTFALFFSPWPAPKNNTSPQPWGLHLPNTSVVPLPFALFRFLLLETTPSRSLASLALCSPIYKFL
ncbi:Uncharacterized protein HZ326_3549 [Fusarium oxysporum f. sp. albedinis]|nr:Uncharacterized protein HZ326_3549 [Fusarium oxysporum f. sp. albedinis]